MIIRMTSGQFFEPPYMDPDQVFVSPYLQLTTEDGSKVYVSVANIESIWVGEE